MLVTDPLRELGLQIKEAREQRSWSQYDLSRESKVSTKYIEIIEGANRSELPEQAYLSAFLQKLIKTLELESELIDSYFNREGKFVVSEIINDTQPSRSTGLPKLDFSWLQFDRATLWLVVGLLFLAFLFSFVATSDSSIGRELSNTQQETNESI